MKKAPSPLSLLMQPAQYDRQRHKKAAFFYIFFQKPLTNFITVDILDKPL